MNDNDLGAGEFLEGEEDRSDVFALYPTLELVSKFAQIIPRTDWFYKIGTPLSEEGRRAAEDYVLALGFPEAHVAAVTDWEEAMATMETGGWNSPSWEAEEQLMCSLMDRAIDIVDEQFLEVALTSISAKASEHVSDGILTAAARFGVDDDELLRAATGMAVKTCYQAALVIAADAEEDHPFALKYRMYETGYWPLDLMGSTYNIF
jgi:hypothetical protein